MNPLRHLLLVISLVFAQLAIGAHAVEHVADPADAALTHACEICLAAHDLGQAMPTVAVLPTVLPLWLIPVTPVLHPRAAEPAPHPVQRGPPRV